MIDVVGNRRWRRRNGIGGTSPSERDLVSQKSICFCTVPRTIISMSFLIKLLLIPTAAIVLLSSFGELGPPVVVQAKEIEATKEWTKLGENDTIGAGLHVRMDLTTGEKWVKLITNDDDDDNNNNNDEKRNRKEESDKNEHQDNKSSSGAAVAITNSDSILQKVVQQEKENDNKKYNLEIISSKTSASEKKKKKYDFDVMYRTLSQLPEEDKQAMNLPQLPGTTTTGNNDGTDSSSTSTNSISQEEFEERMTKIWEYRQEQLRKIQEELVANMPQILKDRIDIIQRYIGHPIYFISKLSKEYILKSTTTTEGSSNLGLIGGINGVDKDDFISILSDLEYHLSDVDMTRDFHTMHGWKNLSSLLSNDIHNTNDFDVVSAVTEYRYNASSLIPRDEYMTKIDVIQTYVAWALGTAVKNAAEFTPYVIEELNDIVSDDGETSQTTTPIDLLLHQIQLTMNKLSTITEAIATPVLEKISSDVVNDDDEQNNNNDESGTVPLLSKQIIIYQKLDKLLYCLGSFLRGNRRAQVHFGAKHGPKVLSTILHDLLTITKTFIDLPQPPIITNTSNKIIQRFIQLVSDILIEVTTSREKYDHIDPITMSASSLMTSEVSDAIVASWATNDWCTILLYELLNPTTTIPLSLEARQRIALSETIFHTAIISSSHCFLSDQKQQLKSGLLSVNNNNINTISSYIARWMEEWDDAMQQQDEQFSLDVDHYQELLHLAQTMNKKLIDISHPKNDDHPNNGNNGKDADLVLDENRQQQGERDSGRKQSRDLKTEL